MGVKHLWAILQGAGANFDYESLHGQVISVDINIWLHQLQSGRPAGQNPHAYLIDLLKRICKLLNYGIKPIFVFDGAHPKLKRSTVMSRVMVRKAATKQYDEAKCKRILKAIEMQIRQGQPLNVPSSTSSSHRDLFELPSSSVNMDPDVSDEEFSDLTSLEQVMQFDPNSEIFPSLPTDIQVGILKLKQSISIVSDSSEQLQHQTPEEISNAQISKLIERRDLRARIKSVVKEKKDLENQSMIGLDSGGFVVESERVASKDETHVVLVKKQVNDACTNNTHSNDTSLLRRGAGDSSKLGIRMNEQTEPKIEPYTPVAAGKQYYIGTNIPQAHNGNQDRNDIIPTMGPISPQLVKVSFTDGTQILAEQGPGGQLTSIGNDDVIALSLNPECITSSVPAPYEDISPPLQEIHLSANGKGHKRSKHSKEAPNMSDLDLTLHPVEASRVVENLSHVSDDVFRNTPSATPVAKRPCVQDTPALELDPQLGLYTETFPDSVTEESIPPTPISPQPRKVDLSPNKVPLPSFSSDETDSTIHSSGCSMAPDSELAPSSSLEEIRNEMSALSRQEFQSQRQIHGVTREIQEAVMELLKVFGIPYIVAPYEAEAQCANLELNKVTTGTITDDSDIFLFGGEKVYRHFFNLKSRSGPQCFCMRHIIRELKHSRQDLIRMAFLLGCDYTEGVKGVGPKNAVSLVNTFKGEGVTPLFDILSAAEAAKSGLKSKCGGEDGLLSRAEFPKGFPDKNVWSAFESPIVDQIPSSSFEWGSIDIDEFISFSKRYFNWKESQAREQITPVLRRVNTPTQSRIIIPRHSSNPRVKTCPHPLKKTSYSGPSLSSASESD